VRRSPTRNSPLYHSLLRAGFSSDVVRRELKAIIKEDVPDVEPEAE
jgi:hypothetical protein